MEILALVGQDQDVGLWRNVQSVCCVVPEHWLRDLGQREQESLFQDRIADFVCILHWLMIWIVRYPLFLGEVDFAYAVLLDLFEVVVSANDYLLSHERDPQRVAADRDLLDF